MNDSEEGRPEGPRPGSEEMEAGGPIHEGRDAGAGPVPDLEALYSDRKPPLELEERVIEEYRSVVEDGWRFGPGHAGRRPRSDAGSWTTRARVAAAIVVFAAGWGAGTLVSSRGEPAPEASESGTPSYMMLLWEGESFAPGDDPAAVAEAYAAWARSVARSGISVSGEELGSDRAIVGGGAGRITGSDRIGGFFLLGAAGLDEARTLAEGHPHVAAGGVIEIAPVVRR